ncbi:Site-specific recombinase XerD [Thioclava dalianensis]|uniref:tyrosine-type recombinase/integrase n=1 Tax=Thioclava dalianensis TaxID=1185766 RepID=UPI0008F6464E|nr:Site-specific recombinase XerD [Thioclava dalianensis]
MPKRFSAIEPRDYVWLALRTDSEDIAQQKAPVVWGEMIEAWEAKLRGAEAEGNDRLSAARDLAARRGYRYLNAPDVSRLPLDELLNRIEHVVNTRGEIDVIEAEAVLGGAEAPKITVNAALEEYWRIEAPKTKGKSDDQIRRWKNPRKKAIKNFVDLKGDMDIAEITTSDFFDFRAWWWERISKNDLTANSANKDFVYLSSTIRTVARAKSIKLKFETEGLAIDEGKKRTRPPFSIDWIKNKLLAPGALDGLNEEARCIVLTMVNTGARPSEIAGLKPHHIHLSAKVPHIEIKAEGRQLKNHHSERVIPLVGISLEAMRSCPEGFPRYFDNPTLSDTVNKYLRANKLLETPAHSLYSLRHAFEDRMLAAGIDERIRRDLFGHSLNRERYGKGADLSYLKELIEPIAL